MHSSIWVLLLVCYITFISGSPTSLLTSAYAKVAKWGASWNQAPVEEGRSNGQALYTQRSDVQMRHGQNLQRDNNVVYHYPSKNVASKKEDGFQDRFNPPPIFLFGDNAKRNIPNVQSVQHVHADHSEDLPAPVYNRPEDSRVSYNSPINSYNPVASGIPDNSKFLYPNNVRDTSVNDNKDNGYVYGAPILPTPPPPAPSPKPTSAPEPMIDSMMMMKPFKFPPYVYDNSSGEVILDHPPSGQSEQDHNKEEEGEEAPHQDYQYDNGGNGGGNGDDPGSNMADDLPEYLDHDPHTDSKYNHYPSFLSSFHDHAHEYFHPKPPTTTTTTTTTEAPAEDENRVNKGHYSYYYLGRKLYYIPLYFSVYFIVYITVLICKSIARHKVNFVHDLDNVNKGRSLEEIADRTERAIIDFRRRFLAM